MAGLDDLLMGGVVAGLLFGVFEAIGYTGVDRGSTKIKGVKKYTRAGKREARKQALQELCRPDLGIHEGCIELGEYE